MPVVTYGPSKVGTEALPGVRKQSAETNLSEGVGLEQARAGKFESLAKVGETVSGLARETYRQARIVQKQEKDRADEIALLDAQNQLDAWEHPRLYDPETGALNTRGKNAMGLPEAVGKEYEDVTGKIAEGLGNDKQRFMFARLKQQRGAALDLNLQRHVSAEIQRYEGQELQATVSNATGNAIANASDPTRVGMELGRAIDAINTHAPRLGLGPEQIAEQISAVQTKTHEGVIEQLLAEDQTKTAQVYFEETRSQISGPAIARIEKALDAGKTQAEAQKQADTIIAAGGTLTDQRNKAKAIDDPKVRDAVMQRIEHEDAVNDRITREAEQAKLNNAYSIVDKTKSVDNISPADQVALATHMPALRAYALQRAKGLPIETDYPTYYGLMTKAGDDPASFVKENLLAYRSRLDDGEFKQLAALQLSIKNGDRNAADKATGSFRTHQQIANNSLTSYGIDPTPKEGTAEAKAVAQFYRMLDVRVSALGKEKPTNDDIQAIADDLLSTSVDVKGSWWNIWPGGKPFFDNTKKVIEQTIADVPDDKRKLIEQSLRANGQRVTDETVLNVWIEHTARKKR